MDTTYTPSSHSEKEKKSYVYGIIRSDISDEQKIVQLGHSCWHAGQSFNNTKIIPSFITLAVKDQEELLDAAERLNRYGIKFHMFYEPDFGPMGHSSICTEALSSAKHRKVMYKWSTYKSNKGNNNV